MEKTPENQFKASLKIDSTKMLNIDKFPSDEDIVSQMDINDKFYSFKMDDIDKKIKISKLTKKGEQIYLYRKNIQGKPLGSCNYLIRTQYFIINDSGKIIGRIPIGISQPNSLTMDYWIKKDFQGLGIGSIALGEVIRQIYEEKAFDGIDFNATKLKKNSKTSIQNIELEIMDHNKASIRIATKNGFIKKRERAYSLTLKDFLDKNREMEGVYNENR